MKPLQREKKPRPVSSTTKLDYLPLSSMKRPTSMNKPQSGPYPSWK